MYARRLAFWVRALCLVCLVIPGSRASAQTTVAVSDANWFFSPYNWRRQGSDYAETTRAGAYFKIGFTGTSAGLGVDAAPLRPLKSSLLPLLRWQIDSQATQDHELQRNDTIIPLKSGPLSPGAHSLTV